MCEEWHLVFSVKQVDGPKFHILSCGVSWRQPQGCQCNQTPSGPSERLRDEPARRDRGGERTVHCCASCESTPSNCWSTNFLTIYATPSCTHPTLHSKTLFFFVWTWKGGQDRGRQPPVSRQSWHCDQPRATIKGDGSSHPTQAQSITTIRVFYK